MTTVKTLKANEGLNAKTEYPTTTPTPTPTIQHFICGKRCIVSYIQLSGPHVHTAVWALPVTRLIGL